MNELSIFNDLNDMFNFEKFNFSLPKIQDFKDFKTLSSFTEKDGKIVLSLHVPVKPESVSVEIVNDSIVVKWEEKTENSSSSGSYTYTIPENADVNTVDAYTEGEMLTVTFNKIEEKPSQKKVNVRVK